MTPLEAARAHVTEELVSLARELGDPDRSLAILGEGNISGRVGTGRMIVKATGASLSVLEPSNLVEVFIDPIVDLVERGIADDESVASVLSSARVDSLAGQPSVEALLHAVALSIGGVSVAAHTHPSAINSILCSLTPEIAIGGALFPDQVVVLGPRQLLVPYVDPGLSLSVVVRDSLVNFIREEGYTPKVIYLANHGIFALADTAREAYQITLMAEKVARILVQTLSFGEPKYLSPLEVERIHTRPDELLRRRLLKDQ